MAKFPCPGARELVPSLSETHLPCPICGEKIEVTHNGLGIIAHDVEPTLAMSEWISNEESKSCEE